MGIMVASSWLAMLLCLLGLSQVGVEKAEANVLRLRYRDANLCHAALINPKQAVTAFHCLEGLSLRHLRAVSSSRSSSKIAAVRKVVNHSNVSSEYKPQEDIALIEFESRFEGSGFNIAPRTGLPATLIRFKQQSSRPNAQTEQLRVQTWLADGSLLFVQPVVCDGDSGSPVLDEAGKLFAIVVGVTASDCRSGMTVLVTLPPSLSASETTPRTSSNITK